MGVYHADSLVNIVYGDLKNLTIELECFARGINQLKQIIFLGYTGRCGFDQMFGSGAADTAGKQALCKINTVLVRLLRGIMGNLLTVLQKEMPRVIFTGKPAAQLEQVLVTETGSALLSLCKQLVRLLNIGIGLHLVSKACLCS